MNLPKIILALLSCFLLSAFGPFQQVERQPFDTLTLPEGAGNLILSGGQSASIAENSVFSQFIDWAGGSDATLLIVAAGFPKNSSTQQYFNGYAKILNVPTQILFVPSQVSDPIQIPEETTGILLLAQDLTGVPLPALSPLKSAWQSGIPLMADGPAAALCGAYYPDTVPNSEPAETEQSEPATNPTLLPGLDLLDLIVHPKVSSEGLWDQLYSLDSQHPELLAVVLSPGSAMQVTSEAAMAAGDSPLFVLDLRSASLSSDHLLANGLVDGFAPGDIIQPEIQERPSTASATATLRPSSTPAPTSTATLPPSPTEIPKVKNPTHTPRPTGTPVLIPPPTDPGSMNWMIAFAVLVVIIILVGVWVSQRNIP